MDALISSVMLLLFFLVIPVFLLVYISQRQDRKLISEEPSAEPLPRAHYELAQREYELFRKKYQKFSKDQREARSSELYFLERKANRILMETEEEEDKYHRSLEHAKSAWRDYEEVFYEIGFFARSFSMRKARELKIFRELFLDAKKKSDQARERILAKERVWIQEGKRNIPPGAELFTLPVTSPEKRNNSTPKITREAYEKMLLTDNGSASGNEHPEAKLFAEEGMFQEKEEGVENLLPMDEAEDNSQFGQSDFTKRYPDFSNSSYIDESFSLKEINQEIIQSATFDRTSFMAITFQGVHQYRDCSFIETDFSHAIFQHAETPHRFLNCDFSKANFSGTRMEYIAFYNCTFRSANFRQSELNSIKFVDCLFEECIIDQVDFSQTVMSPSMLQTIDFSTCAQKPRNWSSQQHQLEREDPS